MFERIDKNGEWYKLTSEGKDKAFKLLKGEMPTSLGESFLSASVLLYGLEVCIRECLSKIDEAPINREEAFKQLNEMLESAKHLEKAFIEASRLARELP